MNAEDTWWWGWSGVAGGAWAGVICLVVILGSVVNLAVLVHWFTTKPLQESPSAAMPFIDFLVCVLAAPLRFVSHAPPENMPVKKDAYDAAIRSTLNFTSEVLQEEAVIFAEFPAGEALEIENVSYYMDQDNDTRNGQEELGIETSGAAAHAVVIFICLSSLHVVVMVAVHRLALLLRCTPSIPLPIKITPPIFVLFVSLVTAGSLVGGLHATGHFTDQLPLLGMVEYPSDITPSPIVIGFLSYAAGLCSIAAFCYGMIITALLHQGRDRSAANTNSRQDPLPLMSSTTSSVAHPPPPEEESPVQGYSGRGRALRACMTVASVLVTLAVCWATPVSLALYALITEAEITPALPYSDVLLLLSGLIHPFVYGEGWIAMATCYSGVCNMLSMTAYRMGFTKHTRTLVRARVADRRLRDERRNIQHHDIGYSCCCCCCPCRTSSRIPDAHLFSEVATFVNSFPLRHALSRHEAEPL